VRQPVAGDIHIISVQCHGYGLVEPFLHNHMGRVSSDAYGTAELSDHSLTDQSRGRNKSGVPIDM